jgi:hypothetical protein
MISLIHRDSSQLSSPFLPEEELETTIRDLFNSDSWLNNPALPQPMKDVINNIVQNLLIGAIETKNLPLIQMMKQRGADFNKFDEEDGSLPLGKAVLGKNSFVITFVIDQGADVNREDGEGYTPLDIAIRSRDVSLMNLLHGKGADLDRVHESGHTCVIRAVESEDEGLIQVLKGMGADIDKPDGNGMNPLTLAFCLKKPKIVKKLQELGADTALSHEILRVKSLSAIWGLGGEIRLKDMHKRERNIAVEGFCSTFTYPLLLVYVEQFLTLKFEGEDLSLEEKKTLLKALKEGCLDTQEVSAESLLQKVQQSTPFVMVQNFSDHVISILLSNNTLMICNRGDEDATMRYGVEIYSLNVRQLTLPIVRQLQKAQGINDLTQLLNSLQESPLQVQYSTCLEQKPQQVGNCTWASLKTLFLALLYTVSELRIPDPAIRRAFVFPLYKRFTAFIRVQALANYLQLSSQPNKDLLESVLEKIDFKTHIPLPVRASLSSRVQEVILKLSTKFKTPLE